MKIKILLLLAIAVVTNLSAQTEPAANPITIGILNVAGPRRTMANNIVSLLTANLSADQRFALVDREELNKVLAEQALGKSGNITPDTASKIGSLTGAKILITGREFMPSGHPVVVIANVIGSENGRVFSMTVQGEDSNLVEVISGLSQKIAETIVTQETNLMVATPVSHEKRIADIVKLIQGKQRPSVSIKINEQMPAKSTANKTAETELGMLFQKTGFTVVDEKSDAQADVIISGDAMFTGGQKTGNLVSSHAIIEIKAQERKGGKILSLERQEATAADASEAIAAKEALQNATDDLSARLLPVLAQ